MKTFLNRFVTTVLLLFLSITLCFQSAAIAAPRGDDGDMRPSRWEVFLETLRPSVANPEGSQPAPGETAEAFRARTGRGDGRDRPEGAGGRDAGQRERNQESGHKGHGGPQDL